MAEYMRIGRYLALVTPKNATGLDFNRVIRMSSWSSEPSLTPWFAPVLERLWDRRPDVRASDNDAAWLRDAVVTDWIGGQIDYHGKKEKVHQAWDRNLGWVIRIMLFTTVVAVALHAVRDYYPHFLGHEASPRDLTTVNLAFLVILLTSVAAALNGYAGQQRHSFHEARSRRMARELSNVRDQLKMATTIADLQLRIAEIRRITLGEATDWFEDMRDQLLDSPT
jgi:hypothetical protein